LPQEWDGGGDVALRAALLVQAGRAQHQLAAATLAAAEPGAEPEAAAAAAAAAAVCTTAVAVAAGGGLAGAGLSVGSGGASSDAAAHAAAQQQQQPQPQPPQEQWWGWEWEDGDHGSGLWTQYPPAVNRQIASALVAGQTRLSVRLGAGGGGGDYAIDTAALGQTSALTGYVRRIRPAPVATPVATPAPPPPAADASA
jgi:hypothetical protein